MSKYILAFGIITSLLIRGFLVLNSKHIADIWHIHQMGEVFLLRQNPYLVLDFNVYPPLAIVLSAFSIIIEKWSSNFFTISYHYIIRFWPNLTDIICAFVIFRYLSKIKVNPINAALWSVFFVLNPISIMISAAQGQLDAITSLLVILSILNFNSRKFYVSAVLLGLSITVKPNPLILIPFFLLFFVSEGKNLKKIVTYLFLILSPLLISMIPFMLQNPRSVINTMIGYSGVSDFSYSPILRGIWYQINAQPTLPSALNNEFLNASKSTVFSGILFLICLFAGWKNLLKVYLSVYLMFIIFYFGGSAQYLAWIIPLAVLARERLIFSYSFLGSIALLGFYLFFGPDVLLGNLTSQMPFKRTYMYLYFYGNLLFWIVCLWWFIKIVLKHFFDNLPKFTKLRYQLIIISFLLFITISLLNIIPLILKFIHLYLQES